MENVFKNGELFHLHGKLLSTVGTEKFGEGCRMHFESVPDRRGHVIERSVANVAFYGGLFFFL